jgi:hypothetical protein
MSDLGYPQDTINPIGNIYSKSSTIFTGTHFGKTKPVHIQRGTIQGDTQSPYLFIISLKQLLQWLEEELWIRLQNLKIYTKFSSIHK